MLRQAIVLGSRSKWKQLFELGSIMGWPGTLTLTLESQVKACGVSLMTWAEHRAEKQLLQRSTAQRQKQT
jgi:hypothetical protein